MTLLEVKDLHVSYGSIKALHGISLRVEQGKIVTLLGANGAGKSTTLRAISGLLRPEQGEVLLEGKPIAGLPPHEIVMRGLSQAPEGRGIFPDFTVDENLAIGGYIRNDRQSLKADREKVLELLPRLRQRLRQPAGTLSGGEQQMLAIARALLAQPRMLLLDEPSLGLAPQLVQGIFEIIRQINAAGTTVLLVEQNASLALSISHEAYVMEVGRIVASGPASQLAASDEIRKAYLGL